MTRFEKLIAFARKGWVIKVSFVLGVMLELLVVAVVPEESMWLAVPVILVLFTPFLLCIYDGGGATRKNNKV